MTDRKARLAAKVKAYNRAHAVAVELYPKLAEVLRPLVGQRIYKADGTLLAKVKSLLPETPSTPGLHVFVSAGGYSLTWTVKANEQDSEHTTVYAEIGLYIGDIKNGVLERLYPPPQLRSDYTADEVEAKRATYTVAKKAADEAKSALHPFGENDF